MAGTGQLQDLASEEAVKLALGINEDPYALERPLDWSNRMSRSVERLSMLDTTAKVRPVSAVGRVDVTDPWGMGWAVDSPYDPSIAYASNPNQMASRQSVYFAQEKDGSVIYNHPALVASSPSVSTAGRTSQTSLVPASYGVANAAAGNGNGNGSGGMAGAGLGAAPSLTTPSTSGASNGIWSEASSSSSATTWNSNPVHATPNDKRRSVSFQGDYGTLAGAANGRKSPSARSWHERSSEPGHPDMTARRSSFAPRAKSNGNVPSLLGNSPRARYADSDAISMRSTRSRGDENLPPIPIDPKILAKREKRMSKAGGGGAKNALPSLTIATSQSTAFNPQNRPASLRSRKSTDNMSITSASGTGSTRAGKRKSAFGWLSRSTSSGDVEGPRSENGAGVSLAIPAIPENRSSPTASRSPSPSSSRRHTLFSSENAPPVPPLPQQARQHSSSSSSVPSSAASAPSPGFDGGFSPLQSPIHLATPQSATLLSPTSPVSLPPSPLSQPTKDGPSAGMSSSGSPNATTTQVVGDENIRPERRPIVQPRSSSISALQGQSAADLTAGAPLVANSVPPVGRITSTPTHARATASSGSAIALAPAAVIKSSTSSPPTLGLNEMAAGFAPPRPLHSKRATSHGNFHSSFPAQGRQAGPPPAKRAQAAGPVSHPAHAPVDHMAAAAIAKSHGLPYIPPNAASLSSFPPTNSAITKAPSESRSSSFGGSARSHRPEQIPLPPSQASSAGPSTPSQQIANPMDDVATVKPAGPAAVGNGFPLRSSSSASLASFATAPVSQPLPPPQQHGQQQQQQLPSIAEAAGKVQESSISSDHTFLRPKTSSLNLTNNGAALPVDTASGPHAVLSSKLGPAGMPVPVAAATPSKAPSKSPFSLFRRNRSKTSGESDRPKMSVPKQPLPSGSQRQIQTQQQQQAQSLSVDASRTSSSQPTPIPTPQLSFSSSTNSTFNTNADAAPLGDGFYSDFGANRPNHVGHMNGKASSSSNGPSSCNSSGTKAYTHQTPARSAPSTMTKKPKEESRFASFGSMFGGKKKASQTPPATASSLSVASQ